MTAISDLLGRASWMYDTRGRVVTETKFITNAGTYTTGFGYDVLDRVITYAYYGDSNRVMQVQISGTQIITTACAGVTRLHIRQDRL